MKKPALLQGGPASGKTYYFWNVMQLIQDLGFKCKHTSIRYNDDSTDSSHGLPPEVFKENDAVLIDGILNDQQLVELYHLQSKHNCWIFLETQLDLVDFNNSTLEAFNIIQFGQEKQPFYYRFHEPSKIPA